MPISTEDFSRLRPFVFHVTARENLSFLRSSQRICTTLNLLESAGRSELADTRRREYLILKLPDGTVVLKDQKPLIEANTELSEGWRFSDFVRFLNGFVYFWPGSQSGPIGPGRRLLQHYEVDGPLVLRVPTVDLLQKNSSLRPLFSAFNSGAPRYHSGRKAKRGPDLFSEADKFPRKASEVRELAFRGNTVLPESTSFRAGHGWAELFDAHE
jgi:hypothetical protein